MPEAAVLDRIPQEVQAYVLKAIEDVANDNAFWEDLGSKWQGRVAPIFRKLVVEGATAAASTGVIVDFDRIHIQALQAVTSLSPIIWSQMEATTREAIRGSLTSWMTGGQGKRGLPSLIASLRPLFDRVRATRIATTEATRFFAEGNRLAVEGDDQVGGLQWQTAEDEKVCPICGPRHMQIYPKAEALMPPAHVNCRCAILPASWRYIRNNAQNWTGPPVPAGAGEPLPVANLVPEIELVPPEPPFKVTELRSMPTSLEGAHNKTVYMDAVGDQWLFKPDPVPGHAELAGYRIMHHLGLEAPETYVVEIGGQKGSIQRMWADTAGKVRVGSVSQLTPAQIGQVQSHQVVDWLLSQHDTNDGALLLSKAGTVRAVDKGQAFKFLGKDQLSWTYKPNPNPIVYNQLFDDYLAGRVSLEFKAIEGIIKRVEAMPNEYLVGILEAYVKNTPSLYPSQAAQKAFVAKILARKASIRKDFTTLYDDALKERTARQPEPRPAVGTVARPGAHTTLDQAFAQDVQRQGWAGRSIMVAGQAIENGNILAYEMTHGTERILTIEAKLRPQAEKALLTKIGSPAIAAPTGSSAGGPPSDGIWQELLPVIKHINFHLGPTGDKKLDPQKGLVVKDITQKIGNLKDAPMQLHYIKIIEDLTGVPFLTVDSGSFGAILKWLEAKGPTGKVYDAYSPPAPKPTAKLVQGLTAKRTTPWRMNATADAGILKTSGGRETLTGGTAFEVDLGKGMTAVYIPQGDANAWSKMGRVQIIRRNYTGSIADLEEATAQLDRLGVEVKLATRQDLELLYLQKAAHAAKIEELDSFKTQVLNKIASIPDMDAEGQIAFHKAFWQQRLGKKLDSLPAYDPTPKFDRNWVPAHGVTDESGGWAWWNRFDLTPDVLEQQMPGYKLIHDITNGDSVLANVKRIVENNGTFSPTEERLRLGLNVSGMSSTSDQSSGGANYVFTRIRDATGHGDYEFKKDLLLRTDNISYGGDKYGNTHASELTERGVTIAKWKEYGGYTGGNETIIKNGLSFFDYLEKINAKTATERTQIVAYLKGKGITELGGKPVDQVVVAR